MIPADACYTVSEMPPQQPHAGGDMGIPIGPMLPASIGVVVIIVATFAFLTNRRKKNTP
jgi:hypothetical protein